MTLHESHSLLEKIAQRINESAPTDAMESIIDVMRIVEEVTKKEREKVEKKQLPLKHAIASPPPITAVPLTPSKANIKPALVNTLEEKGFLTVEKRKRYLSATATAELPTDLPPGAQQAIEDLKALARQQVELEVGKNRAKLEKLALPALNEVPLTPTKLKLNSVAGNELQGALIEAQLLRQEGEGNSVKLYLTEEGASIIKRLDAISRIREDEDALKHLKADLQNALSLAQTFAEKSKSADESIHELIEDARRQVKKLHDELSGAIHADTAKAVFQLELQAALEEINSAADEPLHEARELLDRSTTAISKLEAHLENLEIAGLNKSSQADGNETRKEPDKSGDDSFSHFLQSFNERFPIDQIKSFVESGEGVSNPRPIFRLFWNLCEEHGVKQYPPSDETSVTVNLGNLPLFEATDFNVAEEEEVMASVQEPGWVLIRGEQTIPLIRARVCRQ